MTNYTIIFLTSLMLGILAYVLKRRSIFNFSTLAVTVATLLYILISVLSKNFDLFSQSEDNQYNIRLIISLVLTLPVILYILGRVEDRKSRD